MTEGQAFMPPSLFDSSSIESPLRALNLMERGTLSHSPIVAVLIGTVIKTPSTSKGINTKSHFFFKLSFIMMVV